LAIICRDLGLLSIQAPRTGCTAIEALLVDRFGGEFLPADDIVRPDGFIRLPRKHCSIPQLLGDGLIPADYAARLTTVTAVRNPYDSLVSLYVKKRSTYQPLLQDPTAWVHKVRGYVQDMEFCRTHSFEEWLANRHPVNAIDRLLGRGRRSLYGRYTEGVAVVMRFERLQADFSAVMRDLGVEHDVTIPSINTTPERRASYQSYYTPQARQIVEYVFKPDLDRYGYSFEGLREQAAATPERSA
jgi:hypothetical protein